MTILCTRHDELHSRSCQSCAAELGGELARNEAGKIHCACGLPGEIRIVHDGLFVHIYRCTGCGIQAELAAPGWQWSDVEDGYVRAPRPHRPG